MMALWLEQLGGWIEESTVRRESWEAKRSPWGKWPRAKDQQLLVLAFPSELGQDWAGGWTLSHPIPSPTPTTVAIVLEQGPGTQRPSLTAPTPLPSADQDGAEPSANSVSAHNLLRLHGFTGHKDWMDKCVCLLTAFSERMRRVPVALPEMVRALSAHQQTLKQVCVGGAQGLALGP